MKAPIFLYQPGPVTASCGVLLMRFPAPVNKVALFRRGAFGAALFSLKSAYGTGGLLFAAQNFPKCPNGLWPQCFAICCPCLPGRPKKRRKKLRNFWWKRGGRIPTPRSAPSTGKLHFSSFTPGRQAKTGQNTEIASDRWGSDRKRSCPRESCEKPSRIAW